MKKSLLKNQRCWAKLRLAHVEGITAWCISMRLDFLPPRLFNMGGGLADNLMKSNH
ncbi:hypothetical protein PEC730217_33760 [Pectobacterium carotovorum subsp. carotovorum]|nr:hypothetical protein PEC106664_13150 [Pectobacterium carotovorum subsp. carotovorum]GKW34596.1 hypothetical protein PEC730217_33760 [Pectobacterium carotovorum subsp. carotovorum]